MSGMYPEDHEVKESAELMLSRFDTAPTGYRFFDAERTPAWMTVVMYMIEDDTPEVIEDRLKKVVEQFSK